MKQSDIHSWLAYWHNARMVATDEITSFDRVYQARKYCQCMRVGVFSPDLVTDLEIWRALCAMRADCENGLLQLPSLATQQAWAEHLEAAAKLAKYST
jgi:hypothetical protein